MVVVVVGSTDVAVAEVTDCVVAVVAVVPTVGAEVEVGRTPPPQTQHAWFTVAVPLSSASAPNAAHSAVVKFVQPNRAPPIVRDHGRSVHVSPPPQTQQASTAVEPSDAGKNEPNEAQSAAV